MVSGEGDAPFPVVMVKREAGGKSSMGVFVLGKNRSVIILKLVMRSSIYCVPSTRVL
jgi:hypothetical protein